MAKLTPDEQKKQILYRDARVTGEYDSIWQSTGKCVFCDLNEKYIFFEENGVVMTISLYAYIDGHFMIVPRRHITSIKELSQLEWETVRKFTYLAKKLIKDIHGTKGMQFIQKDGLGAQSTVGHIHFHCVPFDKPDLSVWNYRQLKHTPLENVALYKQARKKIINYDVKFQKKYTNTSSLPVVCDVLILKGNELLLQERADEFKFIPDYWDIPGGVVDDYSASFEQELVREIKEETGAIVNPEQLELYASRIGSTTSAQKSSHLNATYPVTNNFVWNTYVLRDFNPKAKLKAGDDSKALHWVKLADAHKQPLSPGLLATVKQFQRDEASRG
nr:NUDIX domain protein [uncultured bacterium]